MIPSRAVRLVWTGNIRFYTKSFGRIGVEIEVEEHVSRCPGAEETIGKTKWIKMPKTNDWKDSLIRRGIYEPTEKHDG